MDTQICPAFWRRFVGKLAADLVFYAPTIVSYELLRRRARPVMEELPL
jgi:pilus assembly protein TadC